MSDALDKTSTEGLQTYSGAPRDPYKPGEKGRWRRFVEALIPGLKVKWDQAEMLLQAKLHQEAGKALQEEGRGRQEIAKAKILEDRAQSIVESALRIESNMIQEAEWEIISDSELLSEIDELKEDLRLLKIRYGADFEFREGQGDAQ